MRGLAAVLVVGAVFTAAACGSDDDGESTATTAAAEEGGGGTDTTAAEVGAAPDAEAPDEEGATETTEAAAPESELDLDADFIYAYPIGVSRLDPHRASISQDGTTLFPAYDRLVHLAPTGEFIPGLATDWEFSEDGLTLTLGIREGVTFHDGAPFDAEAVKTNIERAKSIEGSSVATDLGTIDTVTVIDPTTVEIGLSQPNVAIIGSFSDRAGIMVSPQALADEVNLDEEMVGAGPYRMVSHTPGATTIFERFEDYWDTENLPKVATLEIRVIADQVARLNALRTGQIHATTIGANQVSEVEGDDTVNVQFNTELQYFYIVQNRSRANQEDVRVRQALLHGLDRQAMCDALLFGYCVLTDQPFPPGYYAYNTEIDDVLYPYDPDRARELLAEAGVESLDLSMLIPAGLATYPEMAEIIQAQWGELGVNVSIEAAEPTQLGELMFAQQTSDALLATWGGRPHPLVTFIQRASSTGFANPGGVTTPRMEELIAEASSLTDADERQVALQAGSREVAESVLEMVLMFPQVPYATLDGVEFTPYLTSKPEFRAVGIAAS
jgi:peptide/nickel transport system substrate-binding protein